MKYADSSNRLRCINCANLGDGFNKNLKGAKARVNNYSLVSCFTASNLNSLNTQRIFKRYRMGRV